MILTYRVAIKSYTKLENAIYSYIGKNNFKSFETFIRDLKFEISCIDFNIGRVKKLNPELTVDLDTQQLETIITYDNAILYMKTIFIKDKDVLFIHYTDSVYITDSSGIVKQDILKFKNNI